MTAGQHPIIIAHRGASGYRPEHTLESYSLAIEMGADFIEPDLVFTADGQLVCRHDRYLGTTTDVADRPEFAARRVLKPGQKKPEWYVEDFTLEELKTLRARQPFHRRGQDHDNIYSVPTFAEVLELVSAQAQARGRPIGIYPETKHPIHFKALGHDFVPPLLSALAAYGFGANGLPAYIQSFEPTTLQRLKDLTDIPLIMLVSRRNDGGPSISLEAAAAFATGVGPDKNLLISPLDHSDTGYVATAHGLGLAVHPWTFRDDFPGNGFDNIEEELAAYLALGVDGLFTDFTDTALRIRNRAS